MNISNLKLLSQFSFSDQVSLMADLILKRKHRLIRNAYKTIKSLKTSASFSRRGGYTLVEWDHPNIKKVACLLRRRSSDFQVFEQIFVNEEYKTYSSFLSTLVDKNEVKYGIDCGANIGLTTLYLKKIFKNLKIVSVEPDKGNFDLLSRNIEINQFEDCKALHGGVSSKDEPLEIDRSFRDGLDWSFSAKPSNMRSSENTVNGYSLKTIMAQNKFPYLDILKIDIEGAEKALFLDKEEISEILKLTKSVVIEIHEEVCPREIITDVFKENGFKYFSSGEGVIAFKNSAF